MLEVAKVALENEMDLILAHKRSMKLAELAGLSLSAQTTFATAVSEVARNTIENGKNGCLVLNVDAASRDKYIVACLNDQLRSAAGRRDGLEYAKRLVDKYQVLTRGTETSIELYYSINNAIAIDLNKVDEWRRLFRNEPPISPYEEIKRKNEMLQELSEKVQKSEEQYRILTNSLPLMIFTLDLESKITYSNKWFELYAGQPMSRLNETGWGSVVHPDDADSFAVLLKKDVTRGVSTVKCQARLKHHSGEYLWHQVSISPFKDEKGEPLYRIGYAVDVHAQKIVEVTMKDNIELKETQDRLRENQTMLERYIDELNRSNRELQQFAFVASHDLQEPVRKMMFYSDFLLNNIEEVNSEKGRRYLSTIHSASGRMRSLISDILTFSQISRETSNFGAIDLNVVVRDALQDLELIIEEKKALLHVDPLPVIEADSRMMRQLFENLISNSLKYSRPDLQPTVQILSEQKDGVVEIRVVDNGIGFDQKYVSQIFVLFQRLNKREEYDGTGIGLAICKKIMEVHGGDINALGIQGQGATFVLTFPKEQESHHPVVLATDPENGHPTENDNI